MAETPHTSASGSMAVAGAADAAQANLPEALRAPTKRLGFSFILMLSLANVALWFSMQPVITYLLPEQIIAFDPNSAHQVLYDGLINGVGAFLSVFSNTLGGAFSDRTTSRFGRRVPWLIGCGALGAGSLILLAHAGSIAFLFIGYGLYQFVVNGALAALTAIVPDKAPEEQRGLVSAFVGLSLPLATVLGAVIIGLVITNVQVGYYILAVALVAMMVIFSLMLGDARLPREAVPPFRLGAFLKSFWLDPRVYPDFGWAWITRFLVNLGWNLTVGTFLLLYLKDTVKVRDPQSSAAIVQIIAVAMILVSSIVGGYISDKLKRRKVLVMGSSALIAVALLILAMVTSFTAVLVAAVVVGLGFGAYLAVDLALLTDVLPSAGDRGKDMGIFNIANALPNAIAPLIGGVVVGTFGSFQQLFFIAAGIVLLASILVQPIKSVR